MSQAITTHALTKLYRGNTVLDSLDLSVEIGQIYGFLGANGAGKTTTLRILLGLTCPTTGTASVLGRDVTREHSSAMQSVGYLPDVPHFPSWMRASDVLQAAGQYHNLDPNTIRDRTGPLLEMVGLGATTARVGSYSRGMTQRLGIARALINAPRVLILDEPTSSLDPAGRHDVLELIGTLRGRTTVLMSTHILSDAEHVCDEVAILDHGRVTARGPLQALIKQNGGGQIYLSITDPNHHGSIQKLHNSLATEGWITSITQVPEATSEGANWLLQVTDATLAGTRLATLISQYGLCLHELKPKAATLEDVFLHTIDRPKSAR